MTTTGMAGGASSAEGLLWWYRLGDATPGPISSTDLRGLVSSGSLDSSTLVWRKGFGAHWKPLDAALEEDDPRGGPPIADYGAWTGSFALSASNPRKVQRSWLGVLGPIGYLYHGMWRRALIIVSSYLGLTVIYEIGAAALNLHTGNYDLPLGLVVLWCVRNLKGDYYRFRVLGEPVWPRLQALNNGFRSGGVAFALLVLAVFVSVTFQPDLLMDDVAGVWQSDGGSIVIDVAGDAKRITYDGAVHRVSLVSFDNHDGVIVFKDIRNPATLITLQKHWADDRKTYTLDLLVDDRFVANLTFIRPA